MKDLDAIYFAARELAPDDRPAYLAEACGSDSVLRSRVEQMLAVADQAEAFITDVRDARTEQRTPGGAPATTRKVDPADVIGQRIGRYKILERVGEGGCGVVYVAEQTEPVRRRVALKVIKLGMDTKAVVARFEAERQALAMMDHPNIAKVLDAGATETGRPYFVMELVRGIRITDYCDQNNLATKDRLDLFMKVCQAIQHAHQKGIIHRDIKPSNILVTLHDGVPVPKVIDFGIAKATEGRLTDATVYTQLHQFIGTPAYMSPEQAEMSGLDIDTRSDIYALGVLLYELLTGQTPFDATELMQSGLDEIRRTIREVEPLKPSTRLSTMLNADLTLVAKCHGLEPSKLSKLVRGDLDWIVMTCLEKDRSRRYETANGLATDIQRHLNNEPIHARPPSTVYRLQKWTRRNKLVFAAGTAIAASLVIGIAASVWQAVRATQAEANARQRLAQIQKGNEIITSIFADLDIRRVKEGNEPLEAVLAQRLVKAAAQLEGEAVGDPLVVAALQDRLGQSLSNLGHAQDAIPLFSNALETRKAKLGAGHPITLGAMQDLAEAYRAGGKLDLALPLLEETLRLRKAKLGVDHRETLSTMNALASWHRDAGKLDLSLRLHEEALKLATTRLGADHRDTLTIMNNLALSYEHAGKLDLALPLFEKVLKTREATQDADHPFTLLSMNNLANCYLAAGKLDLALPLLEKTLRLRKAKLGADHPGTLQSMTSLAFGYSDSGKLDLAIPLFEEALKLLQKKLGADHPNTLTTMNNLAWGYRDSGQLERALPLFEEAAAGIEKRRFQHEHAGRIIGSVIDCHERLQQFDRAEAWRRKWVAVVKERSGADSIPYATELMALGVNLLRQRKWTAAEIALRECLPRLEAKQAGRSITFNTQSFLGASLSGQAKYTEAEPLLLKAYEGLTERARVNPDPARATNIQQAGERLIQLYEAWGKPIQSAEWKAKVDAPNAVPASTPGSNEAK